MKFKAITARNAAYFALAISLAALSTTTFLALSIDRIVEKSVADAVLVTKVRIAELEAAAQITAARASFSKTKAYVKLETDLAEIGAELSSIYSGAPSSQQPTWHEVKTSIDDLVAKAKAKDASLLADLDALIILLRSEQQ